MSELELANGAAADGAAGEALEEHEELDEEAQALLKELEESQAEVQRMLADQRAQASELGGMKDSLSNELQQLQDDAWKLQVFAELEMLKRQLAAINNLDEDLDAMEAKLEEDGEGALNDEFEKELAAARIGTRDLLSRLAGGAGGDADAVAAVSTSAHAAAAGGEAANAAGSEDVEALQDELDAELAAMYKQLQAIKAESAMVAARKAQLELELMQIIREGADDLTEQLKDMAVEDDDEAEGTAGGGGAAEGAAQAAAQQSVAEAAAT